MFFDLANLLAADHQPHENPIHFSYSFPQALIILDSSGSRVCTAKHLVEIVCSVKMIMVCEIQKYISNGNYKKGKKTRESMHEQTINVTNSTCFSSLLHVSPLLKPKPGADQDQKVALDFLAHSSPSHHNASTPVLI